MAKDLNHCRTFCIRLSEVNAVDFISTFARTNVCIGNRPILDTFTLGRYAPKHVDTEIRSLCSAPEDNQISVKLINSSSQTLFKISHNYNRRRDWNL